MLGLRSAAVGWLTLSHCMWGPLALGPAGSDPMSAAPTSADPFPKCWAAGTLRNRACSLRLPSRTWNGTRPPFPAVGDTRQPNTQPSEKLTRRRPFPPRPDSSARSVHRRATLAVPCRLPPPGPRHAPTSPTHYRVRMRPPPSPALTAPRRHVDGCWAPGPFLPAAGAPARR